MEMIVFGLALLRHQLSVHVMPQIFNAGHYDNRVQLTSMLFF